MNARIALIALSGSLAIACQVAFGDFTIDTSQLGVACEAGSARCDGNEIQSCEGGNEWRTLATCASPSLCNLRSRSCAPCETGSYQCNGAQPQICGPDLHWADSTPAPCASATLCQLPKGATPATCLPAACRAGEMQCAGSHLQRCPLSRDAWQDAEVCASPEQCSAEQANAQVAANEPATCITPP